MSGAQSALRDKMIFASGVQRSGTFWLQRLLIAHPAVVGVPSETHLFDEGVLPLTARFHHGMRSSTTVAETWVPREVLIDALRELCDAVFECHLEPGARYLSERTPSHIQVVGLISEIYPDARLIHIIRDGRDVARSLVSRSWGPPTIGDAAAQWDAEIRAARAAAPAESYREVRYEALLRDPQGTMADLFGWLDLPVDDAVLDAVAVEAGMSRNQDVGDSRLQAGKWRDHFSVADHQAFNANAGDLLAELGYASPEDPAPAVPASPPREPAGRRAPPGLASGRLGRLLRRGGVAGMRGDGDLGMAQSLIDELLGCLHTGSVDRLAELVSDGAQVKITTSGHDSVSRGPATLVDHALADPAWRGRQVRDERFPGLPFFTVLLRYRLEDGSEIDRLVAAVSRNGQVVTLTIRDLAA